MISKKFIFLSILTSTILNAETSMFGAGDLESQTPYGLTSAEKVIVKNKQTLKENEIRIKKVDAQLSDLSQRIEALQSIFESESQKLYKLDKSYKSYQESQKVESKTYKDALDLKLNEFQASIDNLQFQINNNKENIKILKELLDEAIKNINKINGDYVSRDEFKREFDQLLKLVDNQISKKSKSPSNDVTEGKSKKELMKEVRILFKKDYFTKALPKLHYLIKNNYRPAECNYYVGEINYYRKNYSDALHYFKKSMILYDKAKYIPKLLLHSAISFEKTGDNENANNFYQTLIDAYPNSAEAKEASKKIK